MPKKHGKIIGLSKIPRLVDLFARRLQVQERLTQEIAQTIEKIDQIRKINPSSLISNSKKRLPI